MKYIEKLYKGGFLFSDYKIKPKKDWSELTINKQYYFYYDSVNNVSFLTSNDCFCLMYGYAMDTVNWHMDLEEINAHLLSYLINDKNKFYDYLDDVNGRFVLIFSDGKELKVLNDATGMKSVYYHKNKILIASHYNIIQDIVNEDVNEYFNLYNGIKENKPWVLPGDLTPYNNIRILISNHEYSITSGNLRRFWPRENSKDVSVNEASVYIADHIEKQLETLSKYKTPIIGLTAGMDSKTTLSASYKIRKKCIYFSYASSNADANSPVYMQKRKADFDYANHIADLYNLNFKAIDLNHPLDSDLLEVAKKNHYHQHIFRCVQPIIESFPSNGIIVQSNLIEIIRDLTYLWVFKPKMPIADQISGWMQYWRQRDILKPYVKQFLAENEYDKIFNYDILHLFYWEYRMTCWNNAATLVENDLASDTYMVFNCRRLLNFGFNIPHIARDKNLLNKKIIKNKWPELLYYIENSKETLSDFYESDPFNRLELSECKFNFGSGAKDPVILKRKYSMTFGFSNLTCSPENWIQMELDLNFDEEKEILISLSTFNNTVMPPDSLLYEMELNDNIVIEDDVQNINQHMHQLKINKGANKLFLSLIVKKQFIQDAWTDTIKVQCLNCRK